MNNESYVERWKREQAEKGEKLQLSSAYGRMGRKSQRRRKESDPDGRAKDQGKTKGK